MTPVFASLADPFTVVAYKALWSAGELTLLAVLASLLSVAWALALAWFGVRRRKLFWSTPTITLAVYFGWLLVRYTADDRSAQFAPFLAEAPSRRLWLRRTEPSRAAACIPCTLIF